MVEDRLYSIGKVAKMMGCSVATLRRWEKEGKIRSVRTPGGHRKFPKEILERLLGGDPAWTLSRPIKIPTSMAERRRFFRVETELPVKCRVQRAGKRASKEFEGVVKNLNVAGAYVGTDISIPAPEERDLVLEFTERNPDVQLMGKIVWINKEKKNTFGFKYGVGVKFADLAEPEADRIAEFLLQRA
jgi:excisionase family DNA binding protein